MLVLACTIRIELTNRANKDRRDHERFAIMEQSPNQSPNAMAKAAYTAAVAQMEKQDKNRRNPEEVESDRENDSLARRGDDGVSISRPAKFLKVHGDGTFSDTNQNNDAGRENDVGARIEEIWKSGTNKTEAKFSETLRLLVGELDSIVQCGLGAFYDLDTTSRQLTQSKELAETRSREAQRLHAIDEQSRASLSVSSKYHSCRVVANKSCHEK